MDKDLDRRMGEKEWSFFDGLFGDSEVISIMGDIDGTRGVYESEPRPPSEGPEGSAGAAGVPEDTVML